MLQALSDFFYTILGGWWACHNGKWVKVHLLTSQRSIFSGMVYIFRKDFEWEDPTILTCGIATYRGWRFKPVLMDGWLSPQLVYVTLTRRIGK